MDKWMLTRGKEVFGVDVTTGVLSWWVGNTRESTGSRHKNIARGKTQFWKFWKMQVSILLNYWEWAERNRLIADILVDSKITEEGRCNVQEFLYAILNSSFTQDVPKSCSFIVTFYFFSYSSLLNFIWVNKS